MQTPQTFDLRRLPFSRYGSYLTVAQREDVPGFSEGTFIRTVHGDGRDSTGSREVSRLSVLADGAAVDTTVEATPSVVRLTPTESQTTSVDQQVELCFPEETVLQLRGSNAGLQLHINGNTTGPWSDRVRHRGEDHWTVYTPGHSAQLDVRHRAGDISIDTDWDGMGADESGVTVDLLPSDGTVEGTVEILPMDEQPKHRTMPAFESARQRAANSFEEWCAGLPSVPEEFESAQRRAGYVTWASVVRPRGLYDRPGMLMSKNHMCQIWSWDHAFNAMALATHRPDLAMDQFLLPFDHQTDAGRLPDSVNDASKSYNFTKTPVHGWALEWIEEHTEGLGPDDYATLYEPLAQWTDWWMDCRDDDNDGIPQYDHGNDAADNSTYFLAGPEIESPDLSACLIVQMEALSRIARVLDRAPAARRWSDRAEQLTDRLVDHSWDEEAAEFVVPTSGTHETVPDADGLLPYRSIVAAEYLPERITESLVADIRDRFVTDYGVASENPESPYYEPDGYWRGAIWAPEVMMIADGLARAGYEELSSTVARRFCETVDRHGMAENFDALSGRGYRDRAYTWTASAFLVLSSHYLDR